MKRIKISELPRQDPYQVPDHYLDQLPQLVQARIVQKPVRSGRLSFWPELQLGFSFLVILCLGGYFMLREPATAEPAAQSILATTPEQEIANYLNGIDNLSIQELSDSSLINSAYAIDQTGEEILANEITLHLDLYSSEELWK